ncbi:upstream activation factor subunit UAF30-like [Mangifera indica]|uniref:upstream activation factor subunit UAF30-like n=1 Tax=Mangifera indica TaxID=29780 RepID=UPI001CFB3FB2|nr:upstream activation factor subunit UAF30-like [Mangifera indica]
MRDQIDICLHTIEEDNKEDNVEDENDAFEDKERSTEVDKDVKKRGGFTKLCSLSPKLQTLVGESELARTEVVKKVWGCIKDNQLQDPKNKQNILCDESLLALFHVSSINMFQMNKALSKHIWPLDKEDAAADSTKKKCGASRRQKVQMSHIRRKNA